MSELNDIAIRLAQRIEGVIVREFLSRPVSAALETAASSTVEVDQPPSFYNLRRCILKELEQIVGVMYTEEQSSDYMMQQMKPEILKMHKESVRQKQAYEIAEMALQDGEIVDRFEFSTAQNDKGWAAYRSVRTCVAFIKLGKIKSEREQ